MEPKCDEASHDFCTISLMVRKRLIAGFVFPRPRSPEKLDMCRSVAFCRDSIELRFYNTNSFRNNQLF